MCMYFCVKYINAFKPFFILPVFSTNAVIIHAQGYHIYRPYL